MIPGEILDGHAVVFEGFLSHRPLSEVWKTDAIVECGSIENGSSDRRI